jgi:hypothetical protein
VSPMRGGGPASTRVSTMSTKVTEESLPPSIASNLDGVAIEGAKIVGVSWDAEPLRIVEAINEFIVASRKRDDSTVDNWGNRALPLGCLWGMQLVRQFGWEWASVTRHDRQKTKAIGVFDKRRSLAVYPFEFIFRTLETRSYPTVLLAFNMLMEGGVPELPEGGYESLMDGVHHIVPPE